MPTDQLVHTMPTDQLGSELRLVATFVRNAIGLISPYWHRTEIGEPTHTRWRDLRSPVCCSRKSVVCASPKTTARGEGADGVALSGETVQVSPGATTAGQR